MFVLKKNSAIADRDVPLSAGNMIFLVLIDRNMVSIDGVPEIDDPGPYDDPRSKTL